MSEKPLLACYHIRQMSLPHVRADSWFPFSALAVSKIACAAILYSLDAPWLAYVVIALTGVLLFAAFAEALGRVRERDRTIAWLWKERARWTGEVYPIKDSSPPTLPFTQE